MMNIMLDRLLIEKNKLEQLEKVMASLDLPFEVYTPEKGQRKGKKRVRSYNGKQADFILHNVEKIISIWPTFLLPPFHEYTDVELCNAAQRNNVSVTQRVMIEKVKTVSQLKEGLAGKNVKNVSNLRKESLLEIAEKHGIETTILEPISQPKPRAILEEELREKLSAKKFETQKETDNEKAIRIWTTIAEMIFALESDETNNSTIANWDSIADTVYQDWLGLHRYANFTVYMDILLSHGAQLHEKWDGLSKYSQQGVEGAHKTQTAFWDQNTPRGGGRCKKTDKPLSPEERRERKYEKMVHSYTLVLVDPYLNLIIDKEEEKEDKIIN
jgi:hypothetical protein